jgi:hypothetical protein
MYVSMWMDITFSIFQEVVLASSAPSNVPRPMHWIRPGTLQPQRNVHSGLDPTVLLHLNKNFVKTTLYLTRSTETGAAVINVSKLPTTLLLL